MSPEMDLRDLARAVVRYIQQGEQIRCGIVDTVAVAPDVTFFVCSVAVAAARYAQISGPDVLDDQGAAAYAWVAGVMAGHHVTADPRVAGV